ncbi:hypothetical protein B484DRAFT_129818 [Ochromonadaceae sp. CCMP2298]|nr:hypothetical protein B484DRAFT_162854 [Ochromonadaceae sp. CCMP2298]KAJ1420490.1 hypothetical protein B484DRAFT_129818 [Ochromonadaceae sp. CCMP2298]
MLLDCSQELPHPPHTPHLPHPPHLPNSVSQGTELDMLVLQWTQLQLSGADWGTKGGTGGGGGVGGGGSGGRRGQESPEVFKSGSGKHSGSGSSGSSGISGSGKFRGEGELEARGAGVGGGGGAQGLSSKGHLLLLLPMCLDLLACPHQRLQQEAVLVVRAVDTRQLAANLHALSQENMQLRARNAALEVELEAVKSANTLPF